MLEAPWTDDTDQNPTGHQTQHRPLTTSVPKAIPLGSFWGLILGHTIVVLPYVVLVMQSAIRGFDERIELVAATLGASRWQVLTRVTLPNVMPSAAAAWIFAFVLSFDEVVITIFVSGTHLTIPKRMFAELSMQVNPTITAVATLLILCNLLALGVLLLLTRKKGLAGMTR